MTEARNLAVGIDPSGARDGAAIVVRHIDDIRAAAGRLHEHLSAIESAFVKMGGVSGATSGLASLPKSIQNISAELVSTNQHVTKLNAEISKVGPITSASMTSAQAQFGKFKGVTKETAVTFEQLGREIIEAIEGKIQPALRNLQKHIDLLAIGFVGVQAILAGLFGIKAVNALITFSGHVKTGWERLTRMNKQLELFGRNNGIVRDTLARFAAALGGSTRKLGLAHFAVGALGRALVAVTPVGVLGLAIGAFISFRSKTVDAKKALDSFRDAAAGPIENLNRLDRKLQDTARNFNNLSKTAIQSLQVQLRAQITQLESVLEGGVSDAINSRFGMPSSFLKTDLHKELMAIRDISSPGTGELERFHRLLVDIGNLDNGKLSQNVDPVIQLVNEVKDKGKELVAARKALQKAFELEGALNNKESFVLGTGGSMSHGGGGAGSSKKAGEPETPGPSKALTETIERLTKENDALRKEIERLLKSQAGGKYLPQEQAAYEKLLKNSRKLGEQTQAQNDKLKVKATFLDQISKDLDNQIATQKLQIRYSGDATYQLEAQLKLRDLILQAEARKIELSESDIETLKRKVELWRQGKVALDAQNKLMEKNREEERQREEQRKAAADRYKEIWNNAIRDIQGLITDTFSEFLDGNLKSAKDYWKAFVKIGKRALANLASAVVTNLFSGQGLNLAALFGGGTPGQAGQSGTFDLGFGDMRLLRTDRSGTDRRRRGRGPEVILFRQLQPRTPLRKFDPSLVNGPKWAFGARYIRAWLATRVALVYDCALIDSLSRRHAFQKAKVFCHIVRFVAATIDRPADRLHLSLAPRLLGTPRLQSL